MTITSTARARSGPSKRKIGAAVTALALAAPLASVAFLAPAAVAAPGDECTINAFIEQDITQSFSAANFDNTKAQISNAFDSFEGTGIPTTIGLSSFGSMAPLPTAPSLIGVDANSAAGAQSLRDQVASYNYMTDPTGQVDQKGEAASGSGATNWQAGLQDAFANAQAQGANKIVFITDGVANAYTNASGQYIKDSIDDAIKAQAAAAAGDVADQIRAAGIELQISFVRTNAVGGGGLDDPMFPANPDLVVQSMQELQPGWTIGNVISVEQIADRILESTLADCSPGTELTKTADLNKLVDHDGDGEISAGDQFPYKFVVKNTGNIPHTSGVVTDEKLTAFGITISSDGKYGKLGTGETVELTSGLYTVTQADIDNEFIDNVALVVSQTPLKPVEDEDPERVPTPGKPSVQVDKSHQEANIIDVNGNDEVDAGDQFPWDIKVTNDGKVTHTAGTLKDELLEKFGVDISEGGKYGDLAPGASLDFTTGLYTITQEDMDRGYVENVVTVNAETPRGPATDDDDDKQPTDSKPSVHVDKSHQEANIIDVNKNGKTDVGDQFPWDIKVTNDGNVTHTAGALKDELLEKFGVDISEAGKYGDLAPGASVDFTTALYTVTQEDMDNGGVHNVVTVNAETPRGPVTDDDDDNVPTDDITVESPVPSPVPPASNGSTLATTGAEQAGLGAAIAAGVLALLGGGVFLALRNRRRESVAANGDAQE